jgi:hypothetical protein
LRQNQWRLRRVIFAGNLGNRAQRNFQGIKLKLVKYLYHSGGEVGCPQIGRLPLYVLCNGVFTDGTAADPL